MVLSLALFSAWSGVPSADGPRRVTCYNRRAPRSVPMVQVLTVFVPLSADVVQWGPYAVLIGVPLRAQTQPARDFERLFARALELQQAGDVLGAIDTYKAALTITPDRADALSNLGAAYVRLGQYDDAHQAIRGGAEVGSEPTTPSA